MTTAHTPSRAHVVRLAHQAIDTQCDAAGASSGFLSSPLQRARRDVSMIRGHVMFDWDLTAQIGGKVALGFEPSPANLLAIVTRRDVARTNVALSMPAGRTLPAQRVGCT